MLKKLKLKFILNNMFLISIVIVTTFSALCLLIYFTEEAKLTDTLEENLQMAQSNIPHLPNSPHEPDSIIYEQSFTVLVNEIGQIVSESPNNIDNSFLEQAIDTVLDAEYGRGNLRLLDLSYMKKEIPNGVLISFISREHLNTRVRESVSQSSLAALVSLLLFLYISKRLADISIAPVEQAWEQQKQFLADASHDLKTPLTVILANNNILSSHKDDTVGSQMKWIDSTNEEAGRMSDLINKMLELAKNESTKEELRVARVDLSETVENAILQFEVVAFERNITIESGIQPGIVVKTHRATVSKILEILFDNAIKYSNENEKIAVTLYQSSKKVYFSINNKGEYIKEDELPHIFERFYRTNKEREVGGHGLGLSLAKKKCDMLGAKIEAESNPEDGTTFTITFKAKK